LVWHPQKRPASDVNSKAEMIKDVSLFTRVFI